MQSACDASPGRAPESTADDIGVLRRTVSADMEAIFRLLPRTAEPEAPQPPAARPARRRRYLWSALAALLIVLSLVAAAWAFLPNMLYPWKVRVPAEPDVTALLALLPPPMDLPPPAPDPAAMDDAQPAPRDDAAAPAPRPRAAPAAAAAPAATASVAAAAPAPAEAAAALPALRCEDTNSAWCMRDRAIAADGALRAAYAQAVEAGVKRSALADIRRDWQRLRKQSDKDPSGMVTGYGDLTGTLRRLTREQPER